MTKRTTKVGRNEGNVYNKNTILFVNNCGEFGNITKFEQQA